MKRLLAAGALVTVPVLGLTTMTALGAQATASVCDAVTARVGTVPGTLSARTADGRTVTLNGSQLRNAATIIEVGAQTPGVGERGVIVALAAALTESGLRMLANPNASPVSAYFPNDGTGADHDSLGMFQMRPRAGWGTVAQLMDPAFQARAFFGGPTGPNHGSPRGLLDITGWEALTPGAAAQAVEVSAYPDRYALWVPVAEQIRTALTTPHPTSPAAESVPTSAGPGVFPLPPGTWTRTSGFGERLNPVLGVVRLHAGVDLAAPSGTPVLATAAGRVVVAEYTGGLGNHVVIEHDVAGHAVASVYGHLLATSHDVSVGDVVLAGQVIGHVGSTGSSTGPHLHFEIHPGGPDAPAVDPTSWLDTATVGRPADVGPTAACPASATGRAG
ncbi:MAG: M23 family metallopeptidase [Promicromonosporaceae bacterium]|nr:M23 family metallopeptidase [Promicromonosporaceae bacterium]